MQIETVEITQGLARETEVLNAVSTGLSDQHLWVWQADAPSLVVPRKLAVLPGFERASQASFELGWPVAMRATGGDATPQGPGIVNVSQVYACAADGFDIVDAYARLCAPLEETLGPGASRGWQAGAFCDGAYNVQYQGRKFAGTALRCKKSTADPSQMVVLAHALMITEMPSYQMIEALNGLLAALDQPRIIDRDAHTGLPEGVTVTDFIDRLVAAFKAA